MSVPATRLLRHLVLADKEYTATVRLGVATVTDDAEGEPVSTASAAEVDEDAVRTAMLALTGEISRCPSAVSAIKVDGRRAHERVRAGERPDLPPRPVTVTRSTPSARRPDPGPAGCRGRCRLQLGHLRPRPRPRPRPALGVGGHLTALRRTRVGPFTLDGAATLDELADRDDPVTLPLVQAVRAAFPVRTLDAAEARSCPSAACWRPSGSSG